MSVMLYYGVCATIMPSVCEAVVRCSVMTVISMIRGSEGPYSRTVSLLRLLWDMITNFTAHHSVAGDEEAEEQRNGTSVKEN